VPSGCKNIHGLWHNLAYRRVTPARRCCDWVTDDPAPRSQYLRGANNPQCCGVDQWQIGVATTSQQVAGSIPAPALNFKNL
jgi:hypothetical protein